MWIEAHRLAVEDAIRFVMHLVVDLEEVESGANEEPIYIRL